MNTHISNNIVESFCNKRVLLLGDTILDIYVNGKAIGKSLETPTIVAKEESRNIFFGGSSLVVRNLLELGAKVDYIFILGDDNPAVLYKDLKHKNLNKYPIVVHKRGTTVKKRFWVDDYKLLQMDNLDNRDVSSLIEKKIIEVFKKLIEKHDTIVISDYRHGMMTENLIKKIFQISIGKKVFVDSQVSHRESVHHLYKKASMIFLSEKEAKTAEPNFDSQDVKPNIFEEKFPNSSICVKLGSKGSLFFQNQKIIKSSALKNISVVDTCGAGDAFLAALCISDFDNITESLCVANYWAGLSTIINGTNPPKLLDLKKVLREK